MSRIAKKPIPLPKGVELKAEAESVSVKGPKGSLSVAKPAGVEIRIEDGNIVLAPVEHSTWRSPAPSARSWTAWCTAFPRASSASSSWWRGYRAAVRARTEPDPSFSHPVLFPIPDGITITT